MAPFGRVTPEGAGAAAGAAGAGLGGAAGLGAGAVDMPPAAALVAGVAWYRVGLPDSSSASPRSARVLRALPTAPALRSSALAIVPGVWGPGFSSR